MMARGILKEQPMFKHARIGVSLAFASGLALSGAPASAASLPTGAALPAIDTPSNFEPARFPHKWRYVGPRYHYRHGPFRYYYGGWWYPRPWWYGPGSSVGIGSFGAYSGYWDDFDWAEGGYTEGTDEHVEWCLDHYRSYDEATDSFLGRDGAPRRCMTPFD